MNDFERMMGMEGVRPLGQPKEKPHRRPAKASPQVHSSNPVAAPEPESFAHAWVSGQRARTALETALERLAVEIRNGRSGWASGIRQDGTMVKLPTSSGAASLLGTADRQSLRLMIIGGDGWTFVMHPLMGVATLDEDPATAAA
ncbi:hypothetical protein [Sphingomonas sp. MMS24-J13]|uniref:hypothetical protein n=1 Tax=Sphingomonas sp. MMS24-J13 TaxID=3238686 RepID=UPI00384B9ECE